LKVECWNNKKSPLPPFKGESTQLILSNCLGISRFY
jgi:hypothetical protein